MINASEPNVMVCAVLNNDENKISSLEDELFAAEIASRKLQSESQTPSFVSAIFVTVNVAPSAALLATVKSIASKTILMDSEQ
jgi:hypothetical protein